TAGWQAFTLPAAPGRAALTVAFGGAGRHGWGRTLPSGVREQAEGDGKTLSHLYPALGLAPRRTVTRFHRTALAHRLPSAVPAADGLAHGAGLGLAAPRTVAVVPHGAGKEHQRTEYVFAADGPLAERRLVRMPGKEVLRREVFGPDGTVTVTRAGAKEGRV